MDLFRIVIGLFPKKVVVGKLPLIRARKFKAVEDIIAHLKKVAKFPAAFDKRSEKGFSTMGKRRAEVRRRQHDDAFYRTFMETVSIVTPDIMADDESARRMDDDIDLFFLLASGRDDTALDELIVEAIYDIVKGNTIFSRLVIDIENRFYSTEFFSR